MTSSAEFFQAALDEVFRFKGRLVSFILGNSSAAANFCGSHSSCNNSLTNSLPASRFGSETLPAIGKSMTFKTVGITPEGKRILRFEHDGTRRHSPIIDSIGAVYIVESKSIAAYLRQLQAMGEDTEDYASIWNYTEGKTEPRFSLYEYPDFPFRITEKMSNLGLESC